MEEEKSVIFLGTPLQFLAVVNGLVFHDGMGDAVNLPPFLSDIKAAPVYLSNVFTWQAGPLGSVAIDPTKPAELDPNRQRITLITDYFDERTLAYGSLASAVTATGYGAEKSIVSIGCAIPHLWAKIEEGWNWLVSELAARGRIEAAPIEDHKDKTTPPVKNLTPEQEKIMRECWLDDSYTFDGIAKEMDLTGQGEFIRKTGYKMGLSKRKIGRKRGR